MTIALELRLLPIRSTVFGTAVALLAGVQLEESKSPLNSVNWQEIRNLLAAIDQSDVVEFSLESQEFTITVRKTERGTAIATTPPVALPPASESVAVPAAAPPAVVAAPPPAASEPAASQPNDNWVAVKAPMVGTFYSAPAPGEAAFASVGDRVKVGQTVCIIEAMKLMNELEAETAGAVAKIMVENAEPVEFGQVLMYIDPA